LPANVRPEDRTQALKSVLEFKSLAWPVAVAIVVGFFHYVGRAAAVGKISALGIHHLVQITSPQDNVFLGVLIVSHLALFVAMAFVFGILMFRLLKLIVQQLPTSIYLRVQVFRRSQIATIVLGVAALIVAVAIGSMASGMVKECDSIVLKTPTEVGTTWLTISMDEEQDWAIAYELLLAVGLTLFLFLSFQIFTRLTQLTWKILYSGWAVIQTIAIVFCFATVIGVVSTIEPYPLVAFSNVKELVGEHVLPLLLGSDDKMFALLIVNVDDTNQNKVPKTILYLPRTEVKWMTVIRMMPLHLVSHAKEIKDLIGKQSPTVTR